MTSIPFLKKIASILLLISLFLDAATFQVSRVDLGHSVSLYELYPIYALVLVSLFIFFNSIPSSIVIKRWILFMNTLIPSLVITVLMQTSFAQSANRMSLSLGFYVLVLALLFYVYQEKNAWQYGLFLGMVMLITVSVQDGSKLSFVLEYQNNAQALLRESLTHLMLVMSSVVLSIPIAWWMAKLAYEKQIFKASLMAFVNFFQVIPTLSYLSLLMIPLSLLSLAYPWLRSLGISGIGFTPAFIVLSSYALMPMMTQIYAGFESIDASIIEAAKGMGLNSKQVFRQIMIPLTLPNFIVGLRVALLQNISSAVLAGLVGGGGLGALIFLGLSQSATDLILLATLPLMAMSYLSERVCDQLDTLAHLKGGIS